MRPTSPTPAALRQERAERLRRDRAATLALRDAFPAVQQLRFELKFEGPAASLPADQSHVLYPPAQAYFSFPCPHADCDGQFDLTTAVSAVLTNQAAGAEGKLQCSGQRLDRRPSRIPCDLHLRYAFSVAYHEAPA